MEWTAILWIVAGMIVGGVPAWLWGRGSALGEHIEQTARASERAAVENEAIQVVQDYQARRRTAPLQPDRWPDYPPDTL